MKAVVRETIRCKSGMGVLSWLSETGESVVLVITLGGGGVGPKKCIIRNRTAQERGSESFIMETRYYPAFTTCLLDSSIKFSQGQALHSTFTHHDIRLIHQHFNEKIILTDNVIENMMAQRLEYIDNSLKNEKRR